jgi:thioredoxin reductase (NADPH)
MDVAIIGAGPAGIAAAIQLRRYGYKPEILERAEPGGLLKNARWVENYPGFPKGIPGIKLVNLLRAHLGNNGPVDRETVLSADYRNKNFIIKTDRRTMLARILIVASGTEPKKIFSARTRRALSGRLFYEPWSMPRMQGQRIAIVGAGDAAFDYALGLASGNKVWIIGRQQKPRCLTALRNDCRAQKGLKYMGRSLIKRIERDDPSIRIRLGRNIRLSVDYILVAAGRKPCLGFLEPRIRKNLRVLMNIKKLWLIGDVKNKRFRQVGISVGDGIRCAMEIADRTGGKAR